MSQVVVPSKMMQIGADKQDELEQIQDQLKLALRDYKTMITLLTDEPENAFAKEEVYRLGLHINALAQNQKLILREIRKKCLDPIIAEPAKPKEHKTLPMVQVEPNSASNEIMSSKEKENEKNAELKATNPPIKIELDVEMGNGLKKDQSENQESEFGKLISVAPLGERAKHVDNMLPNNEAVNFKQRSASPSPNMKMESENDATGAVKFFALLELMPTDKLQQELRTKERKRATRQKRSTANHSQFVYDDSWDQDEKKKKKKDKEKDVISPVSLKIAKPAPEISAEPSRPLNRKREILLARQQMNELEKKHSLSKPRICVINGNDMFRPRKTLAPSILRPSNPSMHKLILPKPDNPTVPKETVDELTIEPQDDEEKLIPLKTRKVISEQKRKRQPQRKPIDFSLEKLPHPGWNTCIGTNQPREKSSFASNINSLIQASQVPPGLSLKIPGLPASLTIERISEQQRVCCMCRKPALITGLFGEAGEKISDALTSCSDCGMTYHLSCTRSTSTSNEFHICPHCFTKQPTYPGACPAVNFAHGEVAAKESRSALILEKIRLINEKESLDKKLLELGTDVTCTFTSGGKTN